MSSVRREPGVGCESPDLSSCEVAFSKEKAQRRIEEEEERRRKADIANTIALEGIKVAFDQVCFLPTKFFSVKKLKILIIFFAAEKLIILTPRNIA